MARTRRQRLPTPDGWTSKGEVIRVTPDGRPAVAPVLVNGGQYAIMPNKKQDQNPTDEIVARGAADVALKLGNGQTRDALVDPQEGDYIPDVETKGYHVGEVRQPADIALTRGGQVVFESTSDAGPSKFESAADQKARSNAREAANPDLYGGDAHVAPSVNASDVQGVGSQDRLRAQGFNVVDDSKGSRSSGKSQADKLEADANATARAQTAEDSK